jgi:hypothetical protein
MTCKDCIYYERCDAIFDGLLSNRNNEPCDWFDNKVYYAKLPAYIGLVVWIPHVYITNEVHIVELTEGRVSGLQQKVDGSWKIRISNKRNGSVSDWTVEEFNEKIFLTKEAAEEYINEKTAKYKM